MLWPLTTPLTRLQASSPALVVVQSEMVMLLKWPTAPLAVKFFTNPKTTSSLVLVWIWPLAGTTTSASAWTSTRSTSRPILSLKNLLRSFSLRTSKPVLITTCQPSSLKVGFSYPFVRRRNTMLRRYIEVSAVSYRTSGYHFKQGKVEHLDTIADSFAFAGDHWTFWFFDWRTPSKRREEREKRHILKSNSLLELQFWNRTAGYSKEQKDVSDGNDNYINRTGLHLNPMRSPVQRTSRIWDYGCCWLVGVYCIQT